MRQLNKEISELRNIINQPHAYHNSVGADQLSICSGVSGDLYEDEVNEQISDIPNASNLEFTFNIETKLKEPSVPKAPDNLVKMLTDVQHFGNTDWSEVRYADTQKLYNHTPGFVDLESNGEIQQYDTLTHLTKADKAYAALTFCILKQKEALQENIRNLLTWAKSETNLENLNSKLEELFLKGDFHTISTDLLQMVCGHRSEIIQVKRDAILKNVKDPVAKVSLNKIPPSTTHIFEADAFSSALEKSGGVRKTFWPPKSNNLQKRSNKAYQGTKKFMGPSSGAPIPYYAAGPSRPMYDNNLPLSRSVYNNNNNNLPLSRGVYHNNVTHDNYQGNTFGNNGSSFQYRGSRSRGTQRGRRGQAPSGHAPRGQSKRYEQ